MKTILSGKSISYVIYLLVALFISGKAVATVRYVKPVASGLGNGSSWANASSDLQLMINNSSINDEVWVAAGTYYPIRRADATGSITTGNRNNAFVLKNRAKIYGGFSGSEIALSERDYLANVTILSGDIGTLVTKTDNCYHVVISAGNISTTQLDGFSIQNAYGNLASTLTVNTETIAGNCGGGICVVNSSVVINNCNVKNNEVTGNGAGMYDTLQSPAISNCIFSANTASFKGGGIYNYRSSPTVTGCTFSGNTANQGGGMYNNLSSHPDLTGCIFSGNTAVTGAGIYIFSSTASFSDCKFTNNISSGEAGGMYIATGGVPTIDKCSFTGNSASTYGAGISNHATAAFSITSTVFSGNTSSSQGGGLSNFSSSPSITNCLFSGNLAVAGGGIINSFSSPVITNCTIAGNKATQDGGGIYNGTSSPSINNSIIYGNIATLSGNTIYTISGTPLVSYSLIEGGFGGSGNINADPLFISAQPASAAPTTLGDYHLRSCSPAIDIGNNSLLPGGITTDLDGNTRIVNTTIDMGAYEKQNVIPDISGIVYVNTAKNGNGSSWATAATELADALKAAKYNTAITQIWVAKGTYFPIYDAATLGCTSTDNRGRSFVLVNNVKIYGGFAGGENTIVGRDFVTNETVLNGDIGVLNDNTDNCYHVVVSAGAVGAAALDGVTIKKANANVGNVTLINSISVDRYRGAAIADISSSPLITNCVITENHAGYGGGIDISPASSPTITNCTFSLNTAASGKAGGIWNESSSSTVITNSTFSGNTGGGISNISSVNTTIANCVFSGNSSGAGVENSNSINTTIVNCIFSGNTYYTGAGIYNFSSSPLISNCTIVANKVTEVGGGIYNSSSSFPVINNCIIWGNTALISNNSIYDNSSSSIVSYSDIEGGYAGTGNVNKDPMFLNPLLATAAPSTAGDHHLHPCSPMVNAGNNSLIPGGATTDCDGNTRIVNTTVDMGAYEIQAGATVSVVPATNIVYVDSSKYGDGSSWATPAHNLADVLRAAKTNTAIQQVWVKKATYLPMYDAATLGCAPTDNRDKSFVLVNNVKVYGGFTGGESTIAGRNFVTNETILNGDIGVANDSTDNCYHVVVSSGSVGIALLDGFTIKKGNANNNSTVTINSNLVDRSRGGGVANVSSSPSITNCIVSVNNANNGGGLETSGASLLTLTNCTISGNTATSSGAGISNSTSALVLTGCRLSGNNAVLDAGAIINGSSGNTKLINCLVSGNKAANHGGAFSNVVSSVFNVSNSTIVGNTALNGFGAVLITASPANSETFSNCIIWGNRSAGLLENFYFLAGPTTTIASYSIIEGGFAGSGNTIRDPQFVSSQPASAAPTTLGNYHLQSCSPALNLGDNASIPVGITTDLDNNPRIAYTTVDMGAYELQSIDLATSTWKGVNTDWNDKINWCGGYIPTAATDVTIPGSLGNYPTIGAAAINAVKNISLANGTSVSLNATGKLTINGTYTNSGSSIINNGSWVMAGNAASQSFPGTLGTVSVMNNLEINNSNGIALNKSFSIKGELTPTAGNINLNNAMITLKSTLSATASIGVIQPAASISYTGTGKFEVERFINTGTIGGNGEHAKSWQFLATPVAGQTIFQSWQEGGLAPAKYGTRITGTGTGFDAVTANSSVKYFDVASVAWKGITNTGDLLQNKLGYMLFVRGDRTVTTYNGIPNNTTLRSKGTIYTPANPPPGVTITANKFQTFGNPYPSRIEFSKVRLASTGIDDVFYVWDPKLAGSYNLGGWQTITGLAGYIPTVGVPPTGNPATAYYPAGVANPYIESGQAVFVHGNGTGGTVNFNEDCKASSSRLVNRGGPDNKVLPKRQFLFTSLFTSSGVIADGNIVAFDNNLSNSLDNNDALKIMNEGENFGLTREDKILAVEARSLITGADTIFFNMKNLHKQSYELRFAPVNMSNMLTAFLVDRFSNHSTVLDLKDSNFVNFDVTDNPASAMVNRFMIVFKQAGIVPITPVDISFIRNSDKPVAPRSENSKQAITVYPNPVTDGKIHLVFTDMPKGIYAVRLINNSGQEVMKKMLMHTETENAQIINIDRKIAHGNYQLEIKTAGKEKFKVALIL